MDIKSISIESPLLKSIQVKHGFFTKHKKVDFTKREDIESNIITANSKLNENLKNVTLLKQIHSNLVIEANSTISEIKGDAIYTAKRHSLIAIKTADCVPILIWDNKNKIAIAIHAGWRGALSDIIKNSINRIKNGKCQLYAAIGPCIRQKNYEVDYDFYNLFLNQNTFNRTYFQNIVNTNKFLFDLPGYCRMKLVECAINNIDDLKIDTYSNEKRFFSYRRSLKKKEQYLGCQLSVIRV